MSHTHFHRWIPLVLMGLALMGCAATHTAIGKRHLDVQTKMSDTIFLTPVSSEKKTAYLQIRNTSDKPALDLTPAITEALVNKGYCLVSDPSKATYRLQANVLQVGKADLRDVHKTLEQGYGASISGAVTGGLTGALISKHPDSLLAGGLLGAGVSAIGNAMIQDVAYSIITDVQISERVGKGEVTEAIESTLKQGNSGHSKQTSHTQTAWKKYQTRIVSVANKVNLKFDEAAPELIAGLSRSISGLL